MLQENVLLTSAVKDNQRIISGIFNSTNEGIYVDSIVLYR